MSANERESGPLYFVAEVIVFFNFPRFRRFSRYFNICKISCVLIIFPRFCNLLRMFHISKIFKILQYVLDFWRFLQILTDCVIFSRFTKNFINLQATASAADPSSTRCFDDQMTRFHDWVFQRISWDVLDFHAFQGSDLYSIPAGCYFIDFH